jgi:hypothetical protein
MKTWELFILNVGDRWSDSSPGSITPKKEAVMKIEERLGGSRSAFERCGEDKPLPPMPGN